MGGRAQHAKPEVIRSPVEIASLAAIGIIGSLAPFVMPVIVGAIVDHLGVTLDQAGYVAFADMTGLGIGAVAWSRMIAWAAWRRYALLGVALVVIGNVLCNFVDHFATLMAARVVVGLGGGLLLAIGNSGLTMTRDPDRTIGIVTVLAMLSASAALFAFPLLVDRYGVGSLFYGMALATGLAGLGTIAMPRHSPNAPSPDLQSSDGKPGDESSRIGLIALGGVFLFFLGAIIFWVYVERLAKDAGFSVATIATVLGVSNLFGALGAITPAVLSTRLGNRRIPLTVAIGMALATSLLLASHVTVTTFAIAACAFIFAWDCFYPYMMGLLISVDPSGKLVSNGLAVQTIGKALGPAIAGALILDIGFAGIYTLCAVLFALSLASFWKPIAYTDRALRAAQAAA